MQTVKYLILEITSAEKKNRVFLMGFFVCMGFLCFLGFCWSEPLVKGVDILNKIYLAFYFPIFDKQTTWHLRDSSWYNNENILLLILYRSKMPRPNSDFWKHMTVCFNLFNINILQCSLSQTHHIYITFVKQKYILSNFNDLDFSKIIKY